MILNKLLVEAIKRLLVQSWQEASLNAERMGEICVSFCLLSDVTALALGEKVKQMW